MTKYSCHFFGAIVIAILICCAHISSLAQSNVVKGFALVIGNNYTGEASLNTAGNDAKEIAKLLEYRNFQVDVRLNVDLAEINAAVQAFAKIDNSQNLPVIFYFAGHGIQINGVNYLIPNNADFDVVPANIPKHTFSLDAVFEAFKKFGNVPKIIILDACRTNPFAENSPNDWVSGLAAPTNASTNTLISFSTNPGNIAKDGVGIHSPYTRSLIKYLQRPGMLAEEIFKKIREDVEVNTDGLQTPWENTSLSKNFYFWEPILFGVKITQADDDVLVTINGADVATKSSDENVLKKFALKEGYNDVVVKVYNQRSYTGGLPGFRKPEGWSYTTSFLDQSNKELLKLNDSENVPADNGPRHGKWFTVAKFQVLVDELTGQMKIVNLNPKIW